MWLIIAKHFRGEHESIIYIYIYAHEWECVRAFHRTICTLLPPFVFRKRISHAHVHIDCSIDGQLWGGRGKKIDVYYVYDECVCVCACTVEWSKARKKNLVNWGFFWYAKFIYLDNIIILCHRKSIAYSDYGILFDHTIVYKWYYLRKNRNEHAV